MLNRTALSVAAAFVATLVSVAPTSADNGRTPDGNRRADLDGGARTVDTRREIIVIGRHAQMFNPGNALRVREDRPYALSGEANTGPRARVDVIRVGSRQVPIGITYDR